MLPYDSKCMPSALPSFPSPFSPCPPSADTQRCDPPKHQTRKARADRGAFWSLTSCARPWSMAAGVPEDREAQRQAGVLPLLPTQG
eukprot:1408563-Rhodomonas_salina.2